MPNYKTMYLQLFNNITTAIEILQKAQQAGEDAYIEDSKEKKEDYTDKVL